MKKEISALAWKPRSHKITLTLKSLFWMTAQRMRHHPFWRISPRVTHAYTPLAARTYRKAGQANPTPYFKPQRLPAARGFAFFMGELFSPQRLFHHASPKLSQP